MIVVREATEGDVNGVRDLFYATYEGDYAYKDFYDEHALKRIIYGEDTLLLVAEDTATGRILGTGAVVLEIGAYSDLVGEFGRLVVHPEHRNEGVGRRLMEERIESIRHRLHLALTEARVVHPFTQRIALKQGFAPVGFVPMKWPFGGRLESQALLARYFGPALELRRNHPRVVPEVTPVAQRAMENVGLTPDLILDDSEPPYPPGEEFEIQELTTEGYSALLRIERGRVRNREVFGPMRLHYGFARLSAEHSNYLIAREDGRIAGAVGFTVQPSDHLVRVFELIPVQDASIRTLFAEVERRCREEWNIHYIEIDVNADAPRIQRTLVELGYLPVAYVPALAFHWVERLDVVRMARLLRPLDLGPLELLPPVRAMADLVLAGFARRRVLPRIAEALGSIELFEGLGPEQSRRLAGICRHAAYAAGERIFREGEPCSALALVLTGKVAVEMEGSREPVGTVDGGECLGEVALLEACRHSATAVARTPVEVGILEREDLTDLVRRRPDIGLVVYRNLARGLGDKLRRTDRDRVAMGREPGSR